MPTSQAISLSTNSLTEFTIVAAGNCAISLMHSMTIRVMNPTTANPVSAPAGPAVLRAFPLFAYILVPIRPPMAINCVKYQCGSAVGVCRLTKICHRRSGRLHKHGQYDDSEKFHVMLSLRTDLPQIYYLGFSICHAWLTSRLC